MKNKLLFHNFLIVFCFVFEKYQKFEVYYITHAKLSNVLAEEF